MAELPVIEATAREGVGKGGARAARRAGMVPGVVYGAGGDPVSINIKHNELLKSLHAGRFLSRLINLRVDGVDNTVICKAVQRDVVRDLPIHADFQRLNERSRVSLYIPVEFLNEDDSPGLKKGGVLTVVRSEVELRVTAGDIPEKLTVDLAGLDLNDTVKISDITLPRGTRPTITDRDFMIATISVPRGLAVAAAEEEGEEGAVEEAAEE
jgi:large subunit ribosomal protein L25